jgi:hypothetical protein
LNPNW